MRGYQRCLQGGRMSKESTLNLFRRLEQLNGIGAALSRERDIDRPVSYTHLTLPTTPYV
mgnify:CR=1 FL=1